MHGRLHRDSRYQLIPEVDRHESHSPGLDSEDSRNETSLELHRHPGEGDRDPLVASV